MTYVAVDAASSVPVHEQLFEQFQRHVLAGSLTPGTRLPAIRQLANDLGLAPGTVARAYTELESAGLVATKRPQGTFVVEQRSREAESARLLRQLARRFAEQAEQLGAGVDDALDAVRGAFAPRT
jgi:GntR family transcriptional regulator